MALFDAAVDLNPHQIEASLFALQSPLSEGVILADEVGLGRRSRRESCCASSGRNTGVAWDLVVIDEAHKLRNAYRPSNKVGQGIRWATEDSRKLLLTATPLQNSLHTRGFRSRSCNVN